MKYRPNETTFAGRRLARRRTDRLRHGGHPKTAMTYPTLNGARPLGDRPPWRKRLPA